MRVKNPRLVVAKKQHDIVVLKNSTSHHYGMVKANRFVILLASTLMVLVFVLGFFLIPNNDARDNFKANTVNAIKNPVLSSEIDSLKGQLVGLLSGSIENKLSTLEQSIRTGQTSVSLSAVKSLRSDLSDLKKYSGSVKSKEIKNQVNEQVLKEVSQLKNLIYLTLTSCGLMIAAIGGFWVRRHYHIDRPVSMDKLGKSE
jgi:hypothetical protein